MRRFSLTLFSLLLTVGCSSQSATSDFTPADTNFAEMMIPHHEQAVVMSEIALANSEDVEVQDLASAILAAQAPEIDQMKSWPGVNPSLHSGHLMDGMLSDSEIEALRQAMGKSFDLLFLEGMIKHHLGAIVMAEDVKGSVNSEVKDLATAIISTQEREIAKMRSMLDQRR
ncbi:MAG: DUF305 domain-containing protein [Actinomycetota bacterium]